MGQLFQNWLDCRWVALKQCSQLIEVRTSDHSCQRVAGRCTLALLSCQSCWNAVQKIFDCSFTVTKGRSQGLSALLSWETHAHQLCDLVFENRVLGLILLFLRCFFLGFGLVFDLRLGCWLLLFLLLYFDLLFFGLRFLNLRQNNTLTVAMTTKKSLSLILSFSTVSSF